MPKSFVTDVLPLFRTGDISCMHRMGLKLDDASWMCDAAAGSGFDDHGNARRVYYSLSQGSMPPDGAWSEQKLEIFSAWMDAGFPK